MDVENELKLIEQYPKLTYINPTYFLSQIDNHDLVLTIQQRWSCQNLYFHPTTIFINFLFKDVIYILIKQLNLIFYYYL